MQIVINIPEDTYRRTKFYKEFRDLNDCVLVLKAIDHAIELPKGHGRLIDADALNIRMEQRMNEIGDDESIWESSNVATALDMFAPTIVEADREGKDASID